MELSLVERAQRGDREAFTNVAFALSDRLFGVALPALGDDGVMYRGPAYGTDAATIYLWRVHNVVLAAIGVGGTDDATVLEIAEKP